MNTATLRIYNSIEDKEPIKTYTCYRLTMDLDDKFNDILEETSEVHEEIDKLTAALNEKSTKEDIKKLKEDIKPLKEKASELTLNTIRLFFPSFTVEDFNKLDPYDYQTFMFEIGEMRNKIFKRAAKN